MEITKHIEIGEYRFELTLKSKSTHAHSLMTDFKESLDSMITYMADDNITKNLPIFISEHKVSKG